MDLRLVVLMVSARLSEEQIGSIFAMAQKFADMGKILEVVNVRRAQQERRFREAGAY